MCELTPTPNVTQKDQDELGTDDASSADDRASIQIETQEDSEFSESCYLSDVKELRECLKRVKEAGEKHDALRKLTAMKGYNGRPLGVVLDVPTRWHSIVDMSSRSLRIMPALNAVLANFKHAPIPREKMLGWKRLKKLLSR